MRDASNDYTVIEATGCQDDNANYQFEAVSVNGVYQFKNVNFSRWLGVICPPGNGSIVAGVPNTASYCFTWVLF